MQRCWTIMFGAIAICGLATVASIAASPSGRPVETETIIVPPDEGGEIDPGLIEPQPGDEIPPEGETAEPDSEPDIDDVAGPPPIVEYDVGKLPASVRRLREQIIEAAVSGDIEKLRPIFEANEEPPVISLVEIDDPIEHLRSLAGDPEGREILAILIEVLDAGYVHVDAGTSEEMYVWPYFARYPLESLSGPQMVELFKLLTAGDYDDMKIYGTYLFYRVGIAPNGVWKYFVAGD